MVTKEQVSAAMDKLPILWMHKHNMRTESGQVMEFQNHKFMWDIYNDMSPQLVCMKAAQITFSTMAIFKTLWLAAHKKIDIIYSLPTDGDVGQFVGGKVNRIIQNNPILREYTKDKDSVEQKQIKENMIYYRGCVDAETEVLTFSGWKKYNEVAIGDYLPSLNLETKNVEADKILDLTVFEADEEVLHLENNSIDAVITKDHRCVIVNRKSNKLGIVRGHELKPNSNQYIPHTTNGIIINGKNDISEALVEVLAWVIAEGSYWTKRDKSVFIRKDGTINDTIYETPKVCIIQKKDIPMIENCLDRAGLGYYIKRHGNNGCVRFELNSKASKLVRDIIPDKKLTFELIGLLNRRQMEIMFDTLVRADGHTNKAGKQSFIQKDRSTIDAFQFLVVLIGKGSTVKYRTKVNSFSDKEISEVSIKTSENICKYKIKTEHYKGIMWCPTTKNSTIFIRRNGKVMITGQTWTNRAALMTSADLYVADEVDRSKMAVVDQYASRLQHSNYKWQWRFSNPSVVGHGVSNQWELSDQMHWFIKCDKGHKQYMSWPDSFDIKGERYVCKTCNATLTPDNIRDGEWVPKYPNRTDWRGYWIPLWIYSVVPAKEIIKYYNEKTPEYFANFVAGLPYVGEGNNIPPDLIWRNLTDDINDQENVVIGCDSGIKKHYVLGNKDGIFYYGVTEDWGDIERYLKRYPRSILVVDALPDITGPRMLQEKFPARVFLNHYSADRKAQQLIRWGQNDEFGSVLSDRNRVIQLLIDQFADMRIPLQGDKNDWADYYSQLKSSYKVIEKNAAGMPVIRWESDGNDHYLHATVYWLIGMDRMGGAGEASIIMVGKDGLSGIQSSHFIDPLTETYKLK